MNAVLCGLLVVVCAFEVSNADVLGNLRIQIQRAENAASSIVSDMTHTSRNLKINIERQIFNTKIQDMTQINDIVGPARTQIRTDVDAAKAQGKDVEHCYTTAAESLKTARLDGFSNLNKCEEDAKNALSQALNGLAAQGSAAERIKADVNGIIASCYSNDGIQTANCVTLKLSSANAAIGALRSSANSAKNQATSDANKAVLSTSNCGMNVVSSFRSGTTDARIAATKCVNNA